MPRLLTSAQIEWKADGTPVDCRHGDIYFAAGDGLEETRAVFLAGCDLPAAWARRETFTIAETGFGTGLNFLSTWQLWRQSRPSVTAWLNFVSFEGFPLRRDDAERALSAWPQLRGPAERLLAVWPGPVRGVRAWNWPGEGVRLVLHLGEIGDTLPASQIAADAWFLDGFSPARNPDMWQGALFRQIAARSRPDARLASFTVAGAVRRELQATGFEVHKRPGHGHKRERLEARLASPPAPVADRFALRAMVRSPQRVAVIGAGIMGATLARSLTDRGACVTVFDAASAPAQAASGNALALVMPRLDAGDSVTARLLADAYLAARSFYSGHPGVFASAVRQMPRGPQEAGRFASLADDPPLPLEDLESLPGNGLLHKRALILQPGVLIASLLDGVEVRCATLARPEADGRRVNGEAFDAVILANAMAAREQAPWLALEPRLGQVEHVRGLAPVAASALAAGHYALALEGERLWGASFEAHDGPPQLRETARAANDAALKSLAPWWLSQVEPGQRQSRAGIRATTPDRLPLAGPLPDFAAACEVFSDLRKGRRVEADAPLCGGLWLATGLGSRGFTFAPWLAGLITAQMFGDPPPATTPAREAVSAMRLILRSLKRGHI